MLTLIAAVRRKPGMTNRAFLHHLHHVHGPLSAAKPLGVRRYVQNHVFDASFGTEGDAAHLTEFGRDAVTELQFDDEAALAATMSDPYTREVIGPDGAHFNDMPSALALLARRASATAPPPPEGLQTADSAAAMSLAVSPFSAKDEFAGQASTLTLLTPEDSVTSAVNVSEPSATASGAT